MPDSLKIGVTGGIGSGKSVVCKIFSVLGIAVYSADDRAKWLMQHSPDLRKSIINIFGKASYINGELNRQFLADSVFNDAKMLETLNHLVHPVVGEDYKAWAEKQAPYSIKEAALMFETDAHLQLDEIICVSAPEVLRINRVLNRDTFRKPSQVTQIIEKQLTEKERNKRCQHIIKNDGAHALIPQVLRLHQHFLSKIS